MISAVRQAGPLAIHGSDFFRPKSPAPKLCVLPPLPALKPRRSSVVLSLAKPLHVSSVETFGSLKERSRGDDHEKRALVTCQAYEADRSQPIEEPAAKSEAARKVKIGIYFATWWALNVVFNIYNKKVLNAYPFPWLTSTLSLAAGSLIMLISWALRIAETPKTDLDFWKTLFPVRNSIILGV